MPTAGGGVGPGMDFMQQTIEEFRAHHGVVREPANFANRLVLVHVPKKDGTVRVVPLAALPRDGAWYVSGSAGGAPKHPDWVFSLRRDRKSTRLNSSHVAISYAVFCLKKKNKNCTPSTA